jgi:hypothetical protein
MDITPDDIPEYCVEILSRPVLDDIVKVAGSRVKVFLDELPVYPDGARHMQGPTVLMRYYQLRPEICNAIGYGIGGPSFRPPAPFRPGLLTILSPYDYCTQFGEAGWFIAPGFLSPTLAEETRLQRLPMGVEFARPVDETTTTRFAVHVADWLRGVSDAGVFGEGPVRCPEAEMSASKFCCKFFLDFAASGPRTLNWFCLSCLDFGINVRPVQGIFFGGHLPARRGALPATKSIRIELGSRA